MKRLCSLLLAALAAWAAADDERVYRRALPGYAFEFPRDHFAHPEFELEWWYYTGNLATAEGRRFGYELTFFRNGVRREAPPRSPWDVDQIYLAHFTVSDLDGGRFFQDERVNRGGPGIAGASLAERAVWNGNWRVDWLDTDSPTGAKRLRAVAEGFVVDFELKPAKAPVVHGIDGVSQKAEGAGRASHYISFTRMETRGEIEIEGRRFAVGGASWMDHEFSTDSLGAGQVGWDWMSILWDDGTELMLYRMRRDDGSTDRYSSGTFVERDGRTRHLTSAEYTMTPGGWWTSPRTAGRYPLAWTVSVPSLGIEFTARTRLEAQEVVSRAGPSYWEGAVEYVGRGPRGPLRGRGYIEMTGYDKPLRLSAR